MWSQRVLGFMYVVTKTVRVHVRGNMKGRVSEKVVSKEGWSLVRGLFTWKCEGKGF